MQGSEGATPPQIETQNTRPVPLPRPIPILQMNPGSERAATYPGLHSKVGFSGRQESKCRRGAVRRLALSPNQRPMLNILKKSCLPGPALPHGPESPGKVHSRETGLLSFLFSLAGRQGTVFAQGAA